MCGRERRWHAAPGSRRPPRSRSSHRARPHRQPLMARPHRLCARRCDGDGGRGRERRHPSALGAPGLARPGGRPGALTMAGGRPAWAWRSTTTRRLAAAAAGCVRPLALAAGLFVRANRSSRDASTVVDSLIVIRRRHRPDRGRHRADAGRQPDQLCPQCRRRARARAGSAAAQPRHPAVADALGGAQPGREAGALGSDAGHRRRRAAARRDVARPEHERRPCSRSPPGRSSWCPRS